MGSCWHAAAAFVLLEPREPASEPRQQICDSMYAPSRRPLPLCILASIYYARAFATHHGTGSIRCHHSCASETMCSRYRTTQPVPASSAVPDHSRCATWCLRQTLQLTSPPYRRRRGRARRGTGGPRRQSRMLSRPCAPSGGLDASGVRPRLARSFSRIQSVKSAWTARGRDVGFHRALYVSWVPQLDLNHPVTPSLPICAAPQAGVVHQIRARG